MQISTNNQPCLELRTVTQTPGVGSVGGAPARVKLFACLSVSPEPELRFVPKKGVSYVVDSRPSSTRRNSRNMNTLMNTLARCRLVLACCVGLSLSSIAAFGQATASPAATTDRTTAQSTTGDQSDRSDHSNWGWVGLLGLLGLTGLMNRRDVDTYNRSNRTESRRPVNV